MKRTTLAFGLAVMIQGLPLWNGMELLANVATDLSPRQSYQMGEEEMKSGNIGSAISRFQESLTADPNQTKVKFRLADALMIAGKHNDALILFQGLLADYPNHVNARVRVSECLIAQGRLPEAVTQLDWVLKVQPDHPRARTLLNSCRRTAVPAEPSIPAGKGVEAAVSDSKPVYEWKQEETSKGRPPAARQMTIPEPGSVKGWKVADFIVQASGSCGIAIEYGRYCIEKGELQKAVGILDFAEGEALKRRDSRRFLETQVLGSLVDLYQGDVRGFGKRLMKLKPMMSKETYASFLDIYNKAQNASTTIDVARLVGGVAMGAGHFAIAEKILQEVVDTRDVDVFAWHLLAQAQMNAREFKKAEKTWLRMVALFPRDPETLINVCRFYLTVRFLPQEARKYLGQAALLAQNDRRVPILAAFCDFSDGLAREAIGSLRQLQGAIDDPEWKALVSGLIQNGEQLKGGPAAVQARFAKIICLPGSEAAGDEAMVRLGEEHLRRGSYFFALKTFNEIKDLAEIGRTYLGLASALNGSGDEAGARIAAGFGMNALNAELKRNPTSAKAHLFLALYFVERNDPGAARKHIQAGLSGAGGGDTAEGWKG